MSPPTLAQVRKWPATVSVPQAATALGCSKSQLYELVKRGEAPVRTLSFGRRHVVITASLVSVLSGDESGPQQDGNPAEGPEAPSTVQT